MFLKTKSSIAAFIACLAIMVTYLFIQVLLVSGMLSYQPWLGYFGLACIGLFFPFFLFLIRSYIQ